MNAPTKLDVLNVGEGHLKIVVEEGDAVEMERAKRIITDMLKRGYAIFVETDEGPVRVKKFDPKRLVYIVDDTAAVTPGDKVAESRPRGRPKKEKDVPVRGSKATAVGRSAGG